MSDWGPWITHDGMGCPIWGQYCQMKFRLLQAEEGIAGSGGGMSWDWSISVANGRPVDHIISYRVRGGCRPITILREIVANPECELEPV